MNRPKIFLTSAGAVVQVRRRRAKPDTVACVGRREQINIRPRPHAERGQLGAGTCHPLTPDVLLWDQLRSQWIDEARFKAAYIDRLRRSADALRPGALAYESPSMLLLVEPGSTLTCSCSVTAGREGRCHRSWAAAALRLLGWSVVLDGEDVSDARAREMLEVR